MKHKKEQTLLYYDKQSGIISIDPFSCNLEDSPRYLRIPIMLYPEDYQMLRQNLTTDSETIQKQKDTIEALEHKVLRLQNIESMAINFITIFHDLQYELGLRKSDENFGNED